LELLPAAAEVFYADKLKKFGWKGDVEALISGTRDEGSPLSKLREHESTIVQEIYSYVANQYARHVKLTVPAALVGTSDFGLSYMQFNHGRRGWKNYGQRVMSDNEGDSTSSGFDDGFVSFARCGRLEFPQPAMRQVNMLPFIFGDKESLPGNLQCYHPLIERCPYLKEDIGQVGYLTVHESYVDVGKAQRREGLHIESPGIDANTAFTPGVEHSWGMGVFWGPDRYDGGIFMASSVEDTSCVWNALVDNRVPGIVDHHGGCEHLRGLIGDGVKLQAGELIWMTDKTPHEALPQKESGFRTFFRVVTPSISVWYADHSTANPKVPLPVNVKVITGSKFEDKGSRSERLGSG